MKGRTRIYAYVLLALIILSVLGYFLLAFYYKNVYSLNTWINGMYCTGLGVDEVCDSLTRQAQIPKVELTDTSGTVTVLNLQDFDYSVDFREDLDGILNKQNSFGWIASLISSEDHLIKPVISYDKEAVRDWFMALNFATSEKEKKAEIVLKKNDDGYYLYNGLVDRINLDASFELLIKAIDDNSVKLDLRDEEILYNVEPDDKQAALLNIWKGLDSFINCDIVMDMGDENIKLDPSIMSEFVLLDNGSLVFGDNEFGIELDEDAVASFVYGVCLEYDTYGVDREFNATRGEVVTIPGEKSTYGTTIDSEAEIQFLLDSLMDPKFHDGIEDVHIPTYSVEALVRGHDDIGGTYIEVDMTDQKMYYYVDYELTIEADVVTGNAKLKRDTPQGVFYVYYKQRNRTLRGEGYQSFVKYWMAIKDRVGLHDASWRKEFGGEIYKKNGSHGCINLPEEAAAELYSLVEKGTPAVVFY